MQVKQQFLQCKSKLEDLHPPIYIWEKARRHRGKWSMAYCFKKFSDKHRPSKTGKKNLVQNKIRWSAIADDSWQAKLSFAQQLLLVCDCESLFFLKYLTFTFVLALAGA